MHKASTLQELSQAKEDIDDKKEDLNNSLDESINKYDSDEENYKKPEEDEDYKDDQELEGNIKLKEIKNDEEDLSIGSVISKIKNFDDNVFKYEHLSYQDNRILIFQTYRSGLLPYILRNFRARPHSSCLYRKTVFFRRI